MSKRSINFIFLGTIATIIVAGAFVPVFVKAQYYPTHQVYPTYDYSYQNQPTYGYQTPAYEYQQPTYELTPFYYPYSTYTSPTYSQPVYTYPTYQYPQYQQPVFQSPVPIYTSPYYPSAVSPLNVSCSANFVSLPVGSAPVTWTAYVTGGTGQYWYSWEGENMSNVNARSVSVSYYYPGTKSPNVTVRSGTSSITKACDSVTVLSPNYRPYQAYYQWGY